MKLMIDISKDRYKDVIEAQKHHLLDSYAQAVANGTPIPDNATNGDVIKALFPNEHDFETDFDADWWNAPYQKGGK